MAILAIAIVMISLGAVSAVDDTSFNQTAITANEDSQDLNLADVNNGDADDIGSQEQNNVGVANENDVLEAADDEDVLGADTTLEIINEKTSYTQNDQITVKMGSYSMASDSSDVDVYLNNDKIATTTYGEVHSSTGFTFSLSNAIIGENTVYCSGSSLFGSYTSDSVTFTVTEDSQSGNSSGGDESGIVLKVTDAYSKYDGQSSSLHFPYTEDYVFIATTGNNARYNAVVTFSVEGASSSAKIKFGSTEQSISSGTATLEFNTDNLGENTIYVVDGSEKSNEVKVYVVSGQNKIASLSVDPEWGVEGQNITITPTAMSSGSSSADGYTSRPISGYVTFYSSSSYTDENRIATVSTDGGSFTVPLVDINAECDYIQLYYTFAGEYNNKGFIHSGSKYVYFLVLDSNPIALTGNGQTGEINLGSDKKINLHVAPTYYMNDGTNSFIDVYVGTDKVGTFSAASTTSVEDFELDLTGYSAGDYDVYVKYEGYNFEDTNQDVYYHAGNESNHLTVHIEDSAPKTLKIDIDAVDYPNEVMAVVTASQTGTYTITIGTKTINVEIGEDDLNGKSVSLGQFDAGDDYTATIVSDDDSTLSNSTPFVVNKGTLTLNVEAVGNNTVYGEGVKTLTASAGDVTSGKVQYFENGVQIGEDSSLGISFDVSSLGVGTHTITVRYIDNNYQAEDQTVIFNIKDILTITLTRNGENVVIKPGDSVYFTITYSEAVSDNLELWINDYKLDDEDGGSSTSITFDASDVGENNVFIKFLGNDNYGACVSNNVTVKVVEPVETTTTLEINTTDILVDGKILITPNVVDSNGNAVTVGTVTIGKDLYGYNDIASINVGETYEYAVDYNDFNPYNNPYFLYARYSGATGENNIYKASQTASGTRYYHIYSNTLTLTATDLTIYAGQSVDLTASVNGNGVITLFVDGVENTTMEKGTPITFTLNKPGDYEFYASYARTTSDYYASCESQKVTVHVLEVVTPVVEIELDKNTVSKDGEITVTPTVSGASEDKGIVEFYDENNNKLGSIDLNANTTFTFTVTGEAGSIHSVWAKYIDANTVFPEVNSSKKDYRIKGILTITLTRNGEGLVKPGDSVGFTIDFSDAVSDNLELWINDYKLGDEDGSESTSITFDASDMGLNNVFVKFLGNDEFEPCVSNNVTVNVVEPVETTITLEINTTDILADGKILITPNVVDSNGNAVTVGTVTIGKDLYGYNDIARINVGETYEYAVDYNDFNPYNNPYFLYARYSGATGENNIYKASQTASGTKYYHVYSNTLTLTVNGESEITAYVGSEVTFLATVGNGEGSIVIVDKDGVETEITGETPIKFDATGDFTYYAKFTRADNSYYASVESSPVTVHVIEKETNEITVSVESITLPGDVTVQVTATKAGNYTVKINDTASTEVKVEVKADGETGSATITLAKGNYSAVVDYSSDIYNVIIHNTTFEVISISAGFNATATPSEVEEGDTVKINTSVKIMGATGEVTIILPNGSEIKVALGEEVSYDASEVGEKTFIIMFDSSNGYLSESVTLTVKVNEKKPIDLTDDVLNITVPTDGSNPVFSVDLPTKENGTLSVTVNNKTYNATVLNGKGSVEVSGLDVGEYNATVVFVDNKNNLRANKTVGFTVPKEDVPADKAFNITSPNDSTSPTFSMDLPGATGNFTVVIGNNTYTKELVDGKATITVDDLNPGEYNATVIYSGDSKHSPISQNTTVNIPTPELSNNKNINVVYSAKATYKVRVTVNGKAVVGQNVTIKYNGKTYNVKTDKNGYATLNLKTNVKVKAYTITATFKGVKVSNKVTVKHMIKAKNLKIKKSKKVVKVKVKTNKVNGKFLKGKKLKLKLKGKTLKAKINKKGVATFKVKKNILKKLKVGKKYTYKVSYGKDIVSKKIKVKR